MPIVQLINLVAPINSKASEFWYADLATNQIMHASPSLEALKQQLRTHGLDSSCANIPPRASWPQTDTHLRQMEQGHPIAVSYAVVWTDKQVAKPESHPDARLWIIQPGPGNILAVRSKIEEAREEFQQLMGSQWSV